MRVFRLEAAKQEVRDARFDIDLDEVATAAERRRDQARAVPEVPVPKVFSLVGKSAAEVGALVGHASQQTTTAEEHAAFGRSAIGRLLSNY